VGGHIKGHMVWKAQQAEQAAAGGGDVPAAI